MKKYSCENGRVTESYVARGWFSVFAAGILLLLFCVSCSALWQKNLAVCSVSAAHVPCVLGDLD